VTDLVGQLPTEIQRHIEHSIAISVATKEPQAAKASLSFLMSPTATAVLKAKGFERD
jgi:ABC-type molybdate transport system substrate-binding protein